MDILYADNVKNHHKAEQKNGCKGGDHTYSNRVFNAFARCSTVPDRRFLAAFMQHAIRLGRAVGRLICRLWYGYLLCDPAHCKQPADRSQFLHELVHRQHPFPRLYFLRGESLEQQERAVQIDHKALMQMNRRILRHALRKKKSG
ncbi:MAG: hypothetical protein SO044_06240 [Agathobaculum sp.]|uniref:hypothetical protein n=1 Tax=Agathobaculum sp. TaxID=2048138 RepID=UPI002A821AD4|nr:hypothetical protein [Agathobaculum sp.]MDY3711994.1 hypothetical protein [Agathobaculum sp.]